MLLQIRIRIQVMLIYYGIKSNNIYVIVNVIVNVIANIIVNVIVNVIVMVNLSLIQHKLLPEAKLAKLVLWLDIKLN